MEDLAGQRAEFSQLVLRQQADFSFAQMAQLLFISFVVLPCTVTIAPPPQASHVCFDPIVS